MARAQKQTTMQTIADEGLKPVTKGETSVTMAQSVIPGLRAKGDALAQTVINEAQSQAGNWTRFYVDLLALSPEGRKAFQDALRAATARPKTEIDGKKVNDVILMQGKDGKMVPGSEPVATAARNSARTRLSEFVTIARAIDAGLKADKDWKFHIAVGYSRTFLRSNASGSNRGRKARTPAMMLSDYLSKNHTINGKTINFLEQLGEDGIIKLVHDLANAEADSE
jgi:hypothetical protein